MPRRGIGTRHDKVGLAVDVDFLGVVVVDKPCAKAREDNRAVGGKLGILVRRQQRVILPLEIAPHPAYQCV